MKDEEPIQRAHDLLKEFLHLLADHQEAGGEVEDIEDVPQIMASLDVLCWVLEHTNNKNFSKNLLRLEAWLYGKGFELKDSGELHNVDQEREG